MGMDVTFAVRTSERLDDDDFAGVRAEFEAAFPDDRSSHRWPKFERDAEDPNAIVIDSLDRFYGTSYSRGYWPRIREMGDWLMVRFGETAEVRYGGDAAVWSEMSPYPERRVENDEHWSTFGHAPYRAACKCDHCAALPGPGEVVGS